MPFPHLLLVRQPLELLKELLGLVVVEAVAGVGGAHHLGGGEEAPAHQLLAGVGLPVHLLLHRGQEPVADLDDLPDVAEQGAGVDPLLVEQLRRVEVEGLKSGGVGGEIWGMEMTMWVPAKSA